MAKNSVIKTCIQCEKEYPIQVRKKDIKKWRDGTLIQEAMPYLEPWEREMFITGICDTCWNRLFGGVQEDEKDEEDEEEAWEPIENNENWETGETLEDWL